VSRVAAVRFCLKVIAHSEASEIKLHSSALLVIVILLTGICASSEGKAQTSAAEAAAAQWLALVDAGNYAASWREAAQLFKTKVSQEQWSAMAESARAPLGKLSTRKLKSLTYETSLPGAPDGQYVIIQYESSFEHKKSAVETVTPMLDKDGQWRVSGYFIK